ncbi:MAG: SUMF1/EgtB/PvdO family nonheme iron enzyme [Flavobacteriales bacterium]|nr:SUMF1/EgtB/PvdO family nonheme iron enzyme [Flavobacteriales bacterium]
MNRIMRLLVLVGVITLGSCGLNRDRGELTGVPGRKPWFHPQPYGTVYVPTGTFHTGQSDQDIFRSYIAPNKQVSIHAMWVDETEITNNEYRQFVYHVIDSLARTITEQTIEVENAGDNYVILDYRKRVDYKNEDLDVLYYTPEERFRHKKQIDTDKLIFTYQWIDYREAAGTQKIPGQDHRKRFVKTTSTPIYPDTLCWIRDFAYSYNEPMTRQYFWHPKYDDYPVVGVNWKQAKAFCKWRTEWLNRYWEAIEQPITEEFRLPTEFEWEYAARGGRDNNMYPWGGPYTRNSKGCFLANFKPNRGDYMGDGGMYPVRADAYFPNDYGLYNMAGNVAEWTNNAYSESTHMFSHDLNPDYQYDAKDDEPITLKRKVIRGGSWKDIAYFIQNGSRTYEYQDTCKSYIGFRCVQTYIGRSALDKR